MLCSYAFDAGDVEGLQIDLFIFNVPSLQHQVPNLVSLTRESAWRQGITSISGQKAWKQPLMQNDILYNTVVHIHIYIYVINGDICL